MNTFTTSIFLLAPNPGTDFSSLIVKEGDIIFLTTPVEKYGGTAEANSNLFA